MDLHKELSCKLTQARKECIHINGLIRKLKSLNSVLKFNKDRAGKELDLYAETIYERVQALRYEVKSSLDESYKGKMGAMTRLKEEYEQDIETISTLCEQAEKLIQFSSTLTGHADRSRANTLIEQFSQLVSDTSRGDMIDHLPRLELAVAVPAEEITKSLIGKILTSPASPPAEASLSKLSINDNNSSVKKSNKDQSTQTEVQSPSVAYSATTQNLSQDPIDNSSREFANINQSNYMNQSVPAAYQAVGSSMGYMGNVYGAYQGTYSQPQRQSASPPPGFHMYQPAVPLVSDVQVNSCLMTNLPVYPQPSQNYPNQYMAMAVPSANYPSQVGHVYSYGVNSPPQNVFYQDQSSCPSSCSQYSYGQTSVGTNRRPPGLTTNIQDWVDTPDITTAVCPISPNMPEVKQTQQKPKETDVQSIPLPHGPAPLSSMKTIPRSKLARIVENEEVENETNTEEIENTQDTKESARHRDMFDLEEEPEKADGTSGSDQKKNDHQKYVGIVEKGKCTDDSRPIIDQKVTSDSKVLEKNVVKGTEGVDHSYSVEKRESEQLITKVKNLLRKDRGNEDNAMFMTARTDEITAFAGDGQVMKDKVIKETKIESDSNKKENTIWIKKEISEKSPTVSGKIFENSMQRFCSDLKNKLENEEAVKINTPLRRPLSFTAPETKPVLNEIKHSIDTHEDESSKSDARDLNDNYVKIDTEIKIEPKDSYQQAENVRNGKEEDIPKSQNSVQTVDYEGDILVLNGNGKPTLRNSMRQKYGSTSTDRNRDTPKAQTNWCKGYIQKRLSGSKESEDWDEEVTVGNDSESGKNDKGTTKFGVNKEECIFSGPSDTANKNVHNEGNSSMLNNKNKDKTRWGLDPNLSVSEWWDSSTESADGDASTRREKTENEKKMCGFGDSCRSKVNTIIDKLGYTDDKRKAGDSEEKESKGGEKKTAVPSRSGFTSFVKGYLGNQIENDQQLSNTAKLGSLQACWTKISNTPGAYVPIKAKLLFKCSADLFFPIGVTANSIGEIIVADTGHNSMKIFSPDGKFLREFGNDLSPALRRPSALAVNERDELFVKDDICIRVFDKGGNFLRNIGQNLLNRPFGLVIGPSGQLVILDTNYRNPCLIHMSQDGKKVSQFPYQPLLHAPRTTKCRFMGLYKSNVIVSDLGASQIYITNLEGKHIGAFGSFGTGSKEFKEPSGISIDQYGNVVIGDSKNNRVQVYRYDGSYTGTVEFDERIVRPSDIHLTRDNRLLVVNYLHHVVKVFQL